MNNEQIPNEEVRKEVLQQLESDYWDTKAAIEVLKAASQQEEAKRAEQEAGRIAEQIKLLDPDFTLEVKRKIDAQFDKETKYLNSSKYKKTDYNQSN